MGNLVFSLNTVLPIFIVGLLGYVLTQRKILSEQFGKTASNACFKFFLPIMLFKRTYNSKVLEQFDTRLAVFCVVGILALVVVASLIWPLFIKDKARCGAAIHSTFRSNFVLLGIPILVNMYGDAGNVAATSVLPFSVIVLNVCAVVIFVIFAPRAEDVKGVSVKGIVKNIVKNPFIIGIFLGFACLALGVKFPGFVTKSVDDLAGMAPSLALLSLGAQFNFKQAKANLKLSGIVSLLRLLIIPVIVTGIGYAIGFRGAELATIYMLFGSPTAVAGAPLAYSMGSDGQLTAEITLLSTILSVASFFIGVWALSAIGV